MRRLLVNFARIGDLVMLTPALRRLSQDAELHLLCRPWGVDLLGEQGLTAGLHVLPHPNHGTVSEWLRGRPRMHLGRHLASLGFDEVITFGIERPVIAEWLKKSLPQATHRSLSAADAGYVPDSIGQALADAGYGGDYRAVPALTVSPAALAAARARLAALGKRVVLVQAGSSSTHKLIRTKPNLRSLTPAQWAGFITRLVAGDEADAVVLLGSPLEKRDAEGIAALVPAALRPRVAVWAGAAPIREQPALAAAAHALISVDTGPAHIAAAVGCPLLMLFGPSIPERWCPRSDGPLERLIGKAPCGPCQNTPRMAACRANICLTQLAEETLFAGWKRLLAQPRAAAQQANP